MSAIGYHIATIRKALDDEKKRVTGGLRSSEPGFLPAALEVIETPVSPTGRITAYALLGGLVVALGWSEIGHVDIVATAQGRVLPSDDVKLVQAANAGVVRRVYVRDGDVVRRGQPLVDLDPTVSTADEAQAQNALLAAELDVARGRAIVAGLSGRKASFVAPAGTPPEVAATQARLVAAQVAAAAAESRGLAAARASALSDAQAASAQAHALADTLPLLDRQLTALRGLAAKGYAPGFRVMELERQRRTEAGNRDVAAAQRSRGLSDAAKFGDQIAQSREQARQSALAELAKAENDAMLRREELTKARRRSRMQRLAAPVDGTVQQLALHTVGGVVEPVRTLMVVVPDGALAVEARIANRDAGFVRAGQRVQVKLEAFPFTRYGSVPGRIAWISRDAVQDRTGSWYVARIALGRHVVRADGRDVALTPGLAVTADIRTGRRRILDYLLDPIGARLSEAARER